VRSDHRPQKQEIVTQTSSLHALTRTLRLAASPISPELSSVNGLVGGGHPSGLAAIGELEIEVVGTPGPSGYLIDITELDRAMRDAAGPRFRDAMRSEAISGRPTDLIGLVCELATALAAILPLRVRRLSYRASPFRGCSIAWSGTEDHPDMPIAVLTETFEFAASHRLHLPECSDEENRRLFGKCNNPNGHGHNYRIEVAASPSEGGRFGYPELEAAVSTEIMARFDHKHLNLDCPEFRATNPSVENIARVCHDLLVPAIAAHGARLRYVRVWETEKTSCIYPA